MQTQRKLKICVSLYVINRLMSLVIFTNHLFRCKYFLCDCANMVKKSKICMIFHKNETKIIQAKWDIISEYSGELNFSAKIKESKNINFLYDMDRKTFKTF